MFEREAALIPDDWRVGNNTGTHVASIARLMLAGEIAYREGRHDEAFAFLREGVELEEQLILCSSVIVLAHSLGLKVVFEGVETSEQLEFLRRKDCDEVQGRAICAPLPAEGCGQFMRENFSKTRLAKIS